MAGVVIGNSKLKMKNWKKQNGNGKRNRNDRTGHSPVPTNGGGNNSRTDCSKRAGALLHSEAGIRTAGKADRGTGPESFWHGVPNEDTPCPGDAARRAKVWHPDSKVLEEWR
jgi:hypothetical protein